MQYTQNLKAKNAVNDERKSYFQHWKEKVNKIRKKMWVRCTSLLENPGKMNPSISKNKIN